jgi:hypothetical protein
MFMAFILRNSLARGIKSGYSALAYRGLDFYLIDLRGPKNAGVSPSLRQTPFSGTSS